MAKALLPNPEDIEEGNMIFTQSAEDITAQQNDIDDQLGSIFSEMGTDKNDVNFHLSIWRIIPNQADMAFLFKCTPADLPIIERLRDEYDGGKFHIQVYRNKKRYRRLTVNVEPPKKNPIAVVKNDMAELVKVLGEQQQNQFNMLRDAIMQVAGKPATPQPSMMEMMGAMIGMMVQMKSFVSPATTAPAVDPEKMMDIFMRGMEMGRESGGNEPEGMMGVLRDLIKSPLLGAAAHAMQNQPVLQHKPNPSPQPAMIVKPQPENKVATQTEVKPAETTKGENMNNPAVKYYVDMLVKKAKEDADPALYAAFILDNVPETMYGNLMQENLLDQLSLINPEVNNYKDWFMELRNEIHYLLTAPEETGDTEGHDTGTTDKPTDDSVRGSGDAGDA